MDLITETDSLLHGMVSIIKKVKRKGKFHPITGHEGPEGE
jgi:hypothetical protein